MKDVLTPQQYASFIVRAFGKKYPIIVKDLWVIPDYDALMKKYLDTKFNRYCRVEWTQLQFKFEAVSPCADFPLGVRTMYRRYAADEVVEIKNKTGEPTGYIEEFCEVRGNICVTLLVLEDFMHSYVFCFIGRLVPISKRSYR